MTDSLVDRIRAALINNQEEQEEAVRFLGERDERIAMLEDVVRDLQHRIKVLRFELSARSAAAEAMREELEELRARGPSRAGR